MLHGELHLHPQPLLIQEQLAEMREDIAELHEKLNLVVRQNDLLVRQNNLMAKQNDFCIRYVQAIALSMGIRDQVKHIDQDIASAEQAHAFVNNSLDKVRDELLQLDERMAQRATDRERDEQARLDERGSSDK